MYENLGKKMLLNESKRRIVARWVEIKPICFIFLFIFFFSFLLLALPEQGFKTTSAINKGIIDGVIIDPETNQNVNTQFMILLGKCESGFGYLKGNSSCLSYLSDNKGNLNFEIEEGSYCIQFIPMTDSKYAFDPDPNMNPNERQEVTVKGGQVTKVQKKAKLGGKLKISLLDPQGRLVNIKSIFENGGANSLLKVEDFILNNGVQSIDEGTAYYPNLLPGIYEIEITFEYMGFGHKCVNNIEIQKGKTTDISVTFDPNDKTGIQGRITNKQGLPIKGITVGVDSTGKEDLVGEINTDVDGFFKIVGLEEKAYDLSITMKDKNSDDPFKFITKKICTINTLKNSIILKNIVVEE